MASDWIINGDVDPLRLTFGERRQIVTARRNGWRIKAGERYVRQAVKCCGDFGNFVAIPALHEICLKYDLYDQC